MRKDLGIWKRIFKGIENERQAFCGPHTVQIDLTDKCNNSCIGCWVHSPLIDKKEVFAKGEKQLSFRKVKKLIKDLYGMGTREIILSGSGEPFLYPEIKEVIKIIKSKNMYLNIITSAAFINEETAELLVRYKVDLITASIWAGNSETYTLTHPGKTEADFEKITDNLIRLAFYKKKYASLKPHLKLYNVICSKNCNDIEKMVEFAKQVDGDSIEFQIIDIIYGKTDSLSLKEEDREKIAEQLEKVRERKDLVPFNAPLQASLDKFTKEEFLDFGKIWKDYKNGFCVAQYSNSLICKEKRNITNKRIIVSESTSTKDTHPAVFWYKFKSKVCRNCVERVNCLDNKAAISVKLLNILGIGSFLRRLLYSDLEKGVYEKQINTMPCYIGWYYARILTNGSVIPCCKAAEFPLGNLYRADFPEIWHSSLYEEFRFKAKNLPKSDKYFSKLNCIKSCDNWGMNLEIKETIFLDKKQKDLSYHLPAKRKVTGEFSIPEAEVKLIIPASGFKSGNLNIQAHEFGNGIIVDGGRGFGFAEYKVHFKENGRYEFWSCYATNEMRPIELYFDGGLITKEALNSTTSGWTTEYLCWFKEAIFDVQEGEHTLRIYTKDFMPHIHSFAFLKGIKYSQRKSKRYLPRTKELVRGLSEDIYQQPSALKLLKDKFKTIGFINSTSKLLNYIRSGRLINNYLDILGIFNSRYAFKGPFHVQIDLTNNCNNNCIGCWCNSPLLEEKALSPQAKAQTLPFALVKELLNELSQMGTKELYLSGGGEPFIHPNIMEILAYIKKKGFTCYVNTNFTLLDKERIKELIDLGIDHLTVSTWSATPETYALTHPNKNEETFRQITENLKFLNRTKRQTPYIKLYNVIFSLNYHELKDMVCFAKETASESVEFTLIDTVPGKTDSLLLNSNQIKELQDSAQDITEHLDSQGYFDRVLLFRFDSFLRRIRSSLDLSKATYDRNIIDKIPCYIGWCFSRIMPNGDINACLKAHRIPVGNLYQDNFHQIWNDKKQQYFRKKTLVYQKKDPFFRLIGNDPDIKEAGCYKSCDDIGRNIYMHNRIMSLTAIERGFLKIASKIKQKPSLNLDSQDNSKDPIISGIINGRRAFVGPEQVVIDITNRCNERCIGCWLYSPLLKKKPNNQWLKQEIDFPKAKSLIDDLADLGTKGIRFTGGGEPFMYPKITELIEYTKTKGLICCLTTNFSLLNKERVRDLIRLKVDELAISLWASNEKTYEKTHFQTQPDIFKKIRENLAVLTNEKKDKPFVTLCNVIYNLNYLEAEEMFRFALDMKVDGVYFTLIDIIKGATDCLLLDEKQKQEVIKQTEKIKQIQQGLAKERRIKLDYFDGFISRLNEEGSLVGNYDRQRVNQIPCYAGWIFARILADGIVCPCCRGVKKPMGNINDRDFGDIWFSQRYNEFRARAKDLPKTDPYFSEIGCTKMCDNLMHNEQMHKVIAESIKRDEPGF